MLLSSKTRRNDPLQRRPETPPQRGPEADRLADEYENQQRADRGLPCHDRAMDIAGMTQDVEKVSASYAEKFDIHRSDDWLLLKLNEEVGELTQAFLARSGQTRDKGRADGQLHSDLGAELADVLAHVLLIAHRFEIDLSDELDRKWLVWKPSR